MTKTARTRSKNLIAGLGLFALSGCTWDMDCYCLVPDVPSYVPAETVYPDPPVNEPHGDSCMFGAPDDPNAC